MKKLLILALLTFALVITAVACTGGDEPTDTTADTTVDTTATTEAPADETEAPADDTNAPAEDTDANVVTNAPEVPTSAPETPTQPEDTDASFVSKIVTISQDELRYLDASLNQIGQAYAPGGANYATWDKVINAKQGDVTYFVDWGWVGFNGDTFQFGYSLNGLEIFADEFAFATEQGVLDAAAAQGASKASRFCGTIPETALTGGKNVIKLLIKIDDQVEVVREYTINYEKLDTSDIFASDVTLNAADMDIAESDLVSYFYTGFPTPGHTIVANGDGLAYAMSGINEILADVTGHYAFSANIVSANTLGSLFVRGTHQVHSVDLPEASGANFPINNYYETDSAGYLGGAGIYATIANGKLFINLKLYSEETISHVTNKQYLISVEGTELTMADDGDTVYILVDGYLYATIELSGEVESYEKLSLVSPETTFAKTATITMGETVETFENTLIAATCNAQIGVAVRGGNITFDSINVDAFSAVTIPDEFGRPDSGEGEDTPTDPNAPVFLITAEHLYKNAQGTEMTHKQMVNATMNEGYVTLEATAGDPYVAAMPMGSVETTTKTLAIKYRTTEALDGQIFIGSGSGWTGNGDTIDVPYNENGEWNLLILDLSGVSALTGNATYLRFDFFTGHGSSIDVAWMGFFENAEEANNYYNGITGDDEPEVEPPYEIDLSTVQFTSSAYAGQYYPGTDPMCAAIHATPGDPTPALDADDTMIIMHYGTVTLGEMDLSMYDKVTITYATFAGSMDVGGVMQDFDAQYNATAKRAMLINQIPAIGPEGVFEGMPTDESVIASAIYAQSSETGLLMTVDIDLTNIDYAGETYFTFDFRNPVDGSFGATSYLLFLTGITFYPAEKTDTPDPTPDPEPEPEPEYYDDYVVDMSAVKAAHAEKYPYNSASTWGVVQENFYKDKTIICVGYDHVWALGDIDFSKYDSVTITYAYDGDGDRNGGTAANAWAASSHTPIIALVAMEKSVGFANVVNQDAIDASVNVEMPHTSGSWNLERTAEISLAGLDQTIPVWLSIFNPWATEVVVTGITFHGAEKGATPVDPTPDPEPEPEPDPEPELKVVGVANDELRFLDAGSVQIGQAYTPGSQHYEAWDKIVTLPYGHKVATLIDWGWVAYNGDSCQFGFRINGVEIFHDAWTVDAEDGVRKEAERLGANNASRFMGTLTTAILVEGKNEIEVLIKINGEVVETIRAYTVVVESAPVLPELPKYNPDAYYQSQEIALGSGPQGADLGGKKLGQRYNTGDAFLTKVEIYNVATYDDGNTNTWTFKVWQWAGAYDATVAGEPLFSYDGTNHNNCKPFILQFAPELSISGDIYYELEYTSGSKQFAGWVANGGVAEGLETYINGKSDSRAFIATITVLNEVAEAPQDNHNFVSGGQGTNGNDVDLKGGFTVTLGLANPAELTVSNGTYTLSGFNSIHAAANGAYAFTVTDLTNVGHAPFGGIFFRGIKNIGEGQYFGADGNDATADSYGAGGIYINIVGDQLRVNVKTYVDGKIVPYFMNIPVSGNDITVVDDGKIISIIVDGKLVATITTAGNADYGLGVASCATVTITTVNGSTTIENALVAAAHTSDLGIATRGAGKVSFTGVSLKPANSVEVPADFEKQEQPGGDNMGNEGGSDQT